MLNLEELSQFLWNQTVEDQFSGVVLIAQNHQILFRKAYGLACKRFNVPNRIDTKFNLGSLNKLFTKVAILQLIEQDKLENDDIVGKFLPEFPPAIANKITIRHLITFTAGLGHYWNERFQVSMSNLRTVDDFVRLFIDDPLLFEPGERREYSNNCYVVLGKIIEVVTGQSYYDYIRQRIYYPAGMLHSDHYELDMPIANLATGYTKLGCCEDLGNGAPMIGARRNNTFQIGIKGSPAGGGYSTVHDLLRFDIALQNNIFLSPDNSRRVLRPVNAKASSQPRVIILAGGTAGVAAYYVKYPRSDHIVIILSNYDPDDVQAVEEQIRNMLLST